MNEEDSEEEEGSLVVMQSAISLTPPPASPAFISSSLSSSNGSSTFPSPQRLLPCKISDQIGTPSSAVPSIDSKSMISGENRAAHREHVRTVRSHGIISSSFILL